MPQAQDVVREVLTLLEPMVAPDGGSIRLTEFAPEQSRLTVDYVRGHNDACSTCVLDGESLKAFIQEGLQTRGIELSDVTVREPGTAA
ncbi:NifU family protein [Streptomyces sp. NBC_01239]|uniref:NifU family protein n=1 Tax=Streptomyces sp. NBC_01239 TaxID=2903792 RepID=UPI002251AC02|nr:NifU family protein [Streptomyces sp. NBC_01239]MCX4815225.1 NifU family protein [Streptomyces sp. NBC_01239]